LHFDYHRCLSPLYIVTSLTRPAPPSLLFPYTTLFRSEALGEDLSERLKKHVADCGARMLFIRRPGREGQRIDRHRFYLCDTRPGSRTIRVGRVEAPEDMLGLDLSPGGDVPGTREVTAPVPLVCTHAKRDQCCAVRGRPVAAVL